MRPTYHSILSLTVIATSAITAGKCVGFDGAQINTLGDKAYGVARNDAAIGEAVTLQVKGLAVVEASEAITVGAELTVDATANVVARTLDTQAVFGWAVTAAAAGDKIEALQA